MKNLLNNKYIPYGVVLLAALSLTYLSQVITYSTFNPLAFSSTPVLFSFTLILGLMIILTSLTNITLGILLPILLVSLGTLVNYGKYAILASPLNIVDFKMGQEVLALNYMDYIDNFKGQLLMVVFSLMVAIFILYKFVRYQQTLLKRTLSILIGFIIFTGSVIGIYATEYQYLESSFVYNFIKSIQQSQYTYEMTDQEKNVLYKVIADMNEYEQRNPTADQKPNVVIVMSEAFFDIEKITSVAYENRPTEFFSHIYENALHGRTEVPVFAGGTSNTEFELLTGISTHIFYEGYNVFFNETFDPTISLASVFKANGYKSIGLHPFWGWYNNRRDIYPNLGFDAFISEYYLNDVQRKGYYISDQTSFENINRLIEETEEPLFLYNITMQNHGPYDDGRYGGEDLNTDIVSGNISEYGDVVLSKYAHGLYDTDQALKYLIESLTESDEETILLFFGDHHPLLGENYQVYKETGYLSGSETPYEKHDKLKTTPFFIWSNYEYRNEDLGKMDISFLGPYLLNMLNLEMPNYYSYLLNLMDQVEYFSFDHVGVAGKFIPINDSSVKDLMAEYDSVVKNYFYGQKNIETNPQAFIFPDTSHFNENLNTIKIISTESDDQESIIYTQPFFDQASVYVNNELIEVGHENHAYRLQYQLKTGDQIKIILKDSKENIISRSETYIVQ